MHTALGVLLSPMLGVPPALRAGRNGFRLTWQRSNVENSEPKADCSSKLYEEEVWFGFEEGTIITFESYEWLLNHM